MPALTRPLLGAIALAALFVLWPAEPAASHTWAMVAEATSTAPQPPLQADGVLIAFPAEGATYAKGTPIPVSFSVTCAGPAQLVAYGIDQHGVATIAFSHYLSIQTALELPASFPLGSHTFKVVSDCAQAQVTFTIE